MKVLTSNSVTVWDEKVGEYVQFFRGHAFEDDDPILDKLDHNFHFKEPETEVVAEPQYYEDLKVQELLEMCRARGLEPESGRKSDLIAALVADDEKE